MFIMIFRRGPNLLLLMFVAEAFSTIKCLGFVMCRWVADTCTLSAAVLARKQMPRKAVVVYKCKVDINSLTGLSGSCFYWLQCQSTSVTHMKPQADIGKNYIVVVK